MAAEAVSKDLLIPHKYTKPSTRNDRLEALVHRNWLR